jgi:hypothetical protein
MLWHAHRKRKQGVLDAEYQYASTSIEMRGKKVGEQ